MEPLSIWIVVGVLFLIIEILSVSFYCIFFGVAALITALLTYLGFTDQITEQLMVFVLSSGVSLYIFRTKLVGFFNKGTKEYKEIIDDLATVSQPIPSNGEGKVFYRGADWIAYTKSAQDLVKDTKVKIVNIDGIKLIVTPV